MRRPRKPSFSIKRLVRRSFWVNPASLMVASLVAVLTLYGLDVHILELIELKTYDLRFVSRGAQCYERAIAINDGAEEAYRRNRRIELKLTER